MKFLRLKKAEVQQPNKPKPTTTLPDNMEWSWDPNAADWVAVMKNNTNVTPPLYNPQNQNMVNTNATTYMSTVKSSSNRALSTLPRLLDKCWYDYDEPTAGRYAQIGDWEIGLGGYDMGYAISYKGTPIFSIDEDNEVRPFLSDEKLQEDFGFSYSDVEKALKKHRDLENIKMVNASKKYAGEEIDKVNLDIMKDIGDTSYALKLLRDGIVTRESRHFDQLVENILNEGNESAAPLTLLSLGILNENDRYYHNAVKQCLPHPTYAAALLERGVITKDSEYYIDAVNSAIRYSDTAKELMEKGIIDQKYVNEESFRRKMKLWSALSEAILMLRENGEEFYDLKVVLRDKNEPEQHLKQALDVAANRLDKIGLKEDADHCRSILKQASKKVKSSAKALGYTKTKDGFVVKVMDKDKDIKADIAVNVDGNDLSFDSNYKFSNDDDTTFEDFTDTAVWYLVDKGLIAFDDNNKWNKVKLSCLSEFLDGPIYSKEIKIEAGLIKDGLVKYAGFDFKRGTKYAITEKGLKVLRSAVEKEHNEALNEREKLAYMFGFNTDKETTLDTTGKTIKADDKDIIVIDTGSGYLQVFENKDTYTYGGHNVGEQLYQFDIDDESKHNGIAVLNVDDMVSKDFYTITFENFDDLEEFVWKLKEATTQKEIASLLNSKPKKVDSSKTFTITEADGSELGKVTASSKLDALVKFGIEHPEYADSRSIKAICANKDNTKSVYVYDIQWNDRERELRNVLYDVPYETLPSSDYIDIEITNVDDYNQIKSAISNALQNKYDELAESFEFEIKDKKVDAKYEETTEQHLDYPNPSITPTKGVTLENHDGWVNTANKKSK